VKGLLTACRYLTAVPLPRAADPGDLGSAAGWFPVVGFALGGILALAGLGADIVTPPSVAAVLLVILWALLTGGLHLDGLGDALDGLGGGFGREEALRLMRAGGIGAYGATGIVLVLALKIAVLGSLPQDLLWRGLVLAPGLGRAAPLLSPACAHPLGRKARDRRSAWACGRPPWPWPPWPRWPPPSDSWGRGGSCPSSSRPRARSPSAAIFAGDSAG